MNRKTALAGLVGCVALTVPVGASTAPLASAPTPQSDVPDATLEATSAEFSQDPVVVPAARGAREWAGAKAAVVAPEQVPTVVLDAYTTAVALAPESCHMTVPLLAAIGQVESGNLVGRQLDTEHRVTPAMVGPQLDGGAFKAIGDTDGGRLDGDKKWDRAVGPMQFLPSTWSAVGVDIDGDGKRDPQSVYDAAGAAMVYLCGDRDLSDPEQLRQAVLSYNRSSAYLQQVLGWMKTFEKDGLAAIASLPIFSATSTGTLGGTLQAGDKPGTTVVAKGKGKGATTETKAGAADKPGKKDSSAGSPQTPGIPSTTPTTPGNPKPTTPSKPDEPGTTTPSEPTPTPTDPVPVTPPPTCESAGLLEVSTAVADQLVYTDGDQTMVEREDGGLIGGLSEVPAGSVCETTSSTD